MTKPPSAQTINWDKERLVKLSLQQYLGHLQNSDPLHHYLKVDILPQLGYLDKPTQFRVFSMSSKQNVYLYEEKHSGIKVVAKFFGKPNQPGSDETNRHLEKELNNLNLLRSYGLVGYPHLVVKPLGTNGWLSSVLIEEYVAGNLLGSIINTAIYHDKRTELFSKLTALAYFLATLHNRTANGLGVNFEEDCRYLNRLVEQLQTKYVMGQDRANELYYLRDRWREQPRMWEDQQVLVHGDATPANFLFGEGSQVIAIDLERSKRADRIFDVGRICGELQYAFIRSSGNKYQAEPFIGHFLWEYACHFPNREQAFASIKARVPFQMALTLLRIARNSWVSPQHKAQVVEEARLTLRTF